ncbi:MAG: hypothetical protein JSS02_27555 [Planctomycetes bacterium]|nr:hypothetical protein [Planctomycetota bacterium]
MTPGRLRRFWFTFDLTISDPHPAGTLLGCGVTALSLEDATEVIRKTVFGDMTMPKIRSIVEDVDVSTLDAKHVLPNMRVPQVQGVWFPLGY